MDPPKSVLTIAKSRPEIDCLLLCIAKFDVKDQFLASRKLSKPGLIYLRLVNGNVSRAVFSGDESLSF